MIAISGFENIQFLGQSVKAPPPPSPRLPLISRSVMLPVSPKPINLGFKLPFSPKSYFHKSCLLLVETTQDSAATTTGAGNSGIQANLTIVKCDSGANSSTESQVIPFQLGEANGSQLIQLETTSTDGWIFCGHEKCTRLILFRAQNMKPETEIEVSQKGQLNLSFEIDDFTLGKSANVQLLGVIQKDLSNIKLYQLHFIQVEAHQVRSLRWPSASLIFLNDMILAEKRREDNGLNGSSVKVWRITDGGRSSELLGKPFRKESLVDIRAWCALQNSLVLYDARANALIHVRLE
jgi:hypothetical protein